MRWDIGRSRSTTWCRRVGVRADVIGEAPDHRGQLRESLVQEAVDFPDTVVRYIHNVVWRKPDVGLWPLSLWIMSPHHILEAGGEELRHIIESAADDVHSVIVAALQAAGTRDRL